MTELAHSRREALRRATVAAGALAAAGLLRPALALAQSSADDDLRDYLVPAVGLEQITVLAYAEASKQADPDVRDLLESFRDQEQAHASAWREALDSLGFDSPDAPNAPDDTSVFDSVDGLSDDTASEYKDLLAKIGAASTPDQQLKLLSNLETQQIAYYVGKAPAVDSFDLATTSAEISGCQAAHLIAIQQQLGDSPDDALKAMYDAIDAAAAAESSDSSTSSSTTSTTSSTSSTTDSTSTTTTSTP
jgi:rubrerythrin